MTETKDDVFAVMFDNYSNMFPDVIRGITHPENYDDPEELFKRYSQASDPKAEELAKLKRKYKQLSNQYGALCDCCDELEEWWDDE